MLTTAVAASRAGYHRRAQDRGARGKLGEDYNLTVLLSGAAHFHTVNSDFQFFCEDNNVMSSRTGERQADVLDRLTQKVPPVDAFITSAVQTSETEPSIAFWLTKGSITCRDPPMRLWAQEHSGWLEAAPHSCGRCAKLQRRCDLGIYVQSFVHSGCRLEHAVGMSA